MVQLHNNKKQEYILNNSIIIEEFFENTQLLLIKSTLYSHALCWQLNYYHGYYFYLSIQPTFIQRSYKHLNTYYKIYYYVDKLNQIEHYLYENKSNEEYLIPHYKHIDYLWLIKGDTSYISDYVINIKNFLINIDNISLVQLVDNFQSIKKIENLYFEKAEEHLMHKF